MAPIFYYLVKQFVSCSKSLKGWQTPNNYHEEHQRVHTVIELIIFCCDTYTHTELFRKYQSSSYLIPTVLALYICILLMNTHFMIKVIQATASLASQELKPRSSTTLPLMFSKHLNVDCSKIESWISKFWAAYLIVFSGGKKAVLAGRLEWNVMNKNNHSLLQLLSLCPGENDISAFSK